MSTNKSSWRGVVDLLEANQLLKYIPEAVPTINSYDNMCTHDVQEYYFLFAHNQNQLFLFHLCLNVVSVSSSGCVIVASYMTLAIYRADSVSCAVYIFTFSSFQGTHSYGVRTFIDSHICLSVCLSACVSVSDPLLIGCEKSCYKLLGSDFLNTNLILDN